MTIHRVAISLMKTVSPAIVNSGFLPLLVFAANYSDTYGAMLLWDTSIIIVG